MKDNLRLSDVSTAEGQMVSIDPNTLPELTLDVKPMPWKPFTDEQKENTACILDDVCVLNIPQAQSPAGRGRACQQVPRRHAQALFQGKQLDLPAPCWKTSMDQLRAVQLLLRRLPSF